MKKQNGSQEASFEKELERLVGLKIVKTENNSIYLDDGTEIFLHPYETYIEKKDLKL